MSDSSASSADFIRNFAKFRREADEGSPVFITSYGRPTHVLMSIEEFEKQGHSRGDVNKERLLESMKELGAVTSEGAIVCDENSVIAHVNQIAAGIMRLNAQDLVGKALKDAIPGFSKSLMETHANHTIKSSEPTAADIPSPFREDAWLHFRSYPWNDWNLLLFRDITEHVRHHRFADVKEGILKGMAVHGEIGYVRLNMRATIDRADEPFCNILGIPQEKLIGASLTDLASKSAKVALRDTIEQVMSDGGQASFSTEFVDNKGETHPMRGGMVALRGAYGWEGAVILFTPDK